MIIYNKSDISKDLTFIQSPSAEDEGENSSNFCQKLKIQYYKNNKQQKPSKTNVLNKTNQDFLKKLGFKLKE